MHFLPLDLSFCTWHCDYLQTGKKSTTFAFLSSNRQDIIFLTDDSYTKSLEIDRKKFYCNYPIESMSQEKNEAEEKIDYTAFLKRKKLQWDYEKQITKANKQKTIHF